MGPLPESLLDATDTKRRIAQQGLASAGAVAIVAGGLTLALARGAARGLGGCALVAGALLVVAASRLLVRWEVPYQGHMIRFENSVVFGERLIVDGERITRGASGRRGTLEGTIKQGSKAGTRVRAETEAGLARFRCRITVGTG